MLDPQNKICLLIGPPGAGKGTLAQLLVDQLNYKHISTGDLCRKHVADETEIGKKIDFFMKSGKLVDDVIINDMLVQWLEEQLKRNSNIVLDGYPRTVEQAKLLDLYIKNEISSVELYVIFLSLGSETIINRLNNRYICANKECQKVYSLIAGSDCVPLINNICDKCSSVLIRRSDDQGSIVKKRFDVYKDQEAGLLSFYNDTGAHVIVVDADQSIGNIFENIKRDLTTTLL